MRIPKKIKWVSVDELSSDTYQEILILLHKHSRRDWYIIFGWVEPINDYTEFKIMAKPNGLSRSYPDVEIPKNEIISVGTFQSYGYIKY